MIAHPMHRETSGFDAAGAAMPKDVFDQVLVFAHVKLHNQSKEPLFLHQIMANATLDDGIHTSYVAGPTEYERAFMGYPELARAARQTPRLGTHPGGGTDRGRRYPLLLPPYQAGVGCAQGAGFHLWVPLSARPQGDADRAGY